MIRFSHTDSSLALAIAPPQIPTLPHSISKGGIHLTFNLYGFYCYKPREE